MNARVPPRWVAPVYAAALVAGAGAVLATSGGVETAGLLDAASTSETTRFAAGIFLLAACATGILTLQYPGRPNVSLLLLPTLLAWWSLPLPVAAAVAGFGQLFGNAWRRAPVLQSLAGGARTFLAVWLAGSAARALVADNVHATSGQFTSWWFGALALFTVVFSAADFLLDDLGRRLFAPRATPAAAPGFAVGPPGAQSGGWGRVGRMDPLVNVLALPLAVAFEVVNAALGFERMAIVLGGMLALLLVVRSLTNLRTAYGLLAEQRAKLATLFDHSGEGIFTVDGELKIDTVNPAMASLLGQPEEAFAGAACADVCRFEDLHGQHLCPERCPLVQAHDSGKPVTMEVLYPVEEEPPRHLLLTYASVGEPGEPLSLGIGIVRDMTAEREAQKIRDEFVSLVTHELRSPLTVSIGYLDLLKRSLGGEEGMSLDPQKGLYYAGRIESAERHLLRLVNNLLELARVERPDLELDLGWVDLATLIDETVDGIRTLASGKNQQVSLELPAGLPRIWSSDLYLKEILGNLVSNGVKYTPEGGRVAVTVRLLQPATANGESHVDGEVGAGERRAEDVDMGGRIEIAVADTGYGMSQEDLGKLFSRFFRSGRPEIRKERGTGLGLALTKSMAEKIGGTISVASELGKGSTFTVTLPLSAGPAASEAPVPAEAA